MTDACQVCGSPAHARLCDMHRDELVDALRELGNSVAVDEVAPAEWTRPEESEPDWARERARELAEKRGDRTGPLSRELRSQGLYEDVVDTAYRLDNTGPTGVPVTTGEVVEVTHHAKAAEVRDLARNTITTWARDLAERHPHLTLPTTVPAAAAWLATLIELLAQHEAAGEIYRDIIGLPGRIRRVVQPPDLTYLGICSANVGGEPCPNDVFADRDSDLDMTQCRRCWTWHDIATRRERMLRAMEDQLLTATDMRTVLTRYMPSGVPPASTIRWWASIGKLNQKPPHPDKPRAMRYRVGDVLDLVARQEREESA